MKIRRAEERDIEKVLDLLKQVLTVHADIRPDYFVHGTTKYNREELQEMFKDENRPVYVYVNDDDIVLGYAFVEIKEQPKADVLVPFKYFYIDDICVDEAARCQGVATALYNHVVSEARRLGCYEINLNVWEGNDNARRFYESMGMKTLKTTMEFIL